MGAAGNAATARALSRSTTPAVSGAWAASAQDGQGNASVAALLGQPAPAARPGGGQREKPGFWDKITDPWGTATSFAADKAWALLRRHAPVLVPILQQGLGSWLQDRLANAMRWLLGVLTAPVRALGGAATALNKQFGRLVGWMRTGVGKLLSSACGVISAGSEKVVEVVDGIEEAEDKGIAKLKGLASSAGDFLGGLWDDLGAPVAEVLGQAGSAVWEKIQQVAGWLWDKTEPIRELGAAAWNWLKNVIGIGSGPEGRHGIIQWVQARAQGAWDWIKSNLGELPTSLKVAGGVLLLLSPAGPVLAAGALAYGVVKGARWLWKYLSDPDALVKFRQTLVDEVLPELRESIGSVKDAINTGVEWLTTTLDTVGAGLRDLAAALTAPIVAPLASLVDWLREQNDRLVRWVAEHVRPLAELVHRGLARLRKLGGQLLVVLKQVITAVNKPFGIGGLLLGHAWRSLPACMRSAILKFLLRLVQGALRLMPTAFLGPVGAVIRQALIGFVSRALEEQNLAQLEQLANRFSSLATKGSWDFTLGYGIGLLKGVWDGISGPFLMMWDIATLIGNAVGWVRDLVQASLTAAGRKLISEIKSAWHNISDEIKPAVSAFLKGPVDPGRIFKLITGVLDEVASAARDAGAKVFDKLMEYLKQSDRKLGESLGFITGSIIFEVTLTVLTMGGYAAKAAVQRVAKMFTKITSKIGDLLKELRALQTKGKNMLDKVSEFAGNKNKSLQRLVDNSKKLLDKLLELLDLKHRGPDKKDPAKDPTDDDADHDRKDPDQDKKQDKDSERREAVAEARAIVARSHRTRTPLRKVLRKLRKLKRRYRWINKFEVEFTGRPSTIRITLIGSNHSLGELPLGPNGFDDPVTQDTVRNYMKEKNAPETSGMTFTPQGKMEWVYGTDIISSGKDDVGYFLVKDLADRIDDLIIPSEFARHSASWWAAAIVGVSHHVEPKVAAWMGYKMHGNWSGYVVAGSHGRPVTSSVRAWRNPMLCLAAVAR